MSFDQDPITISFDSIKVPVKAVLRRLGYPVDEELNGQVKPIFEAELERAPEYFEPKGVYRILPIASMDDRSIRMKNEDFHIESCQVAKMLKDSSYIVLFMSTLGPKLEEEVKRLFDQDHMAEAVILDAIGSETADAVADELHHKVMKSIAADKGYRITPRFSPGYGDWSVTVQNEFLSTCGGDLIGITVNDSSLMHPRKSVSAVLGFIDKNHKGDTP